MATKKKQITYYAFAGNARGQIEQMFVLRVHQAGDGATPLVSSHCAWTGVIYKNEREAFADMGRLNCR